MFRKRKQVFMPSPEPPVIIRTVEQVEDFVDGVSVQHEVIVPMTDVEYLEKHPPVTEDYTLLEQLQAGVSVKEVPTSSLLDSSDNLDYIENEDAEEKVLAQLEKDAETLDKQD